MSIFVCRLFGAALSAVPCSAVPRKASSHHSTQNPTKNQTSPVTLFDDPQWKLEFFAGVSWIPAPYLEVHGTYEPITMRTLKWLISG